MQSDSRCTGRYAKSGTEFVTNQPIERRKLDDLTILRPKTIERGLQLIEDLRSQIMIVETRDTSWSQRTECVKSCATTSPPPERVQRRVPCDTDKPSPRSVGRYVIEATPGCLERDRHDVVMVGMRELSHYEGIDGVVVGAKHILKPCSSLILGIGIQNETHPTVSVRTMFLHSVPENRPVVPCGASSVDVHRRHDVVPAAQHRTRRTVRGCRAWIHRAASIRAGVER